MNVVENEDGVGWGELDKGCHYTRLLCFGVSPPVTYELSTPDELCNLVVEVLPAP